MFGYITENSRNVKGMLRLLNKLKPLEEVWKFTRMVLFHPQILIVSLCSIVLEHIYVCFGCSDFPKYAPSTFLGRHLRKLRRFYWVSGRPYFFFSIWKRKVLLFYKKKVVIRNDL